MKTTIKSDWFSAEEKIEKSKKITKLTKWQKHFNLNLTRNNIAL